MESQKDESDGAGDAIATNDASSCRSSSPRHPVPRLYPNIAEVTEDKETTEVKDKEPSETKDKESSETKYYRVGAYFEWVPMNLDEDSRTEESHEPPEGAVLCGTSKKGYSSYVARAYFYNDRLPASYVPRKKVAYAGWNGEAHALADGVEVLVLRDASHEWVPCRKGGYPTDALPTGYSHLGEVTYTGREMYEGSLRLGKVHPSYKKMFITHRGVEVGLSDYEVQVVTPREKSLE
ncbi:uncharacterized protein LOC108090252 [Drosophila ficusphila]|uniref:uncharacterized protein LOC108090252 n=1 Tax=Drosophila ficusphila TaxID=30025 RepID=UPI0007E6091A|nr:uncharacterized protein LOC108090252 [Drosophila ficusphila]